MRQLANYLLLATLALGFEPASAQMDPSRPGYYREWLQKQVDEWSRVSEVKLRETTHRTFDGPSGAQSVRLSADVTVYPGERDANRTIVAAE